MTPTKNSVEEALDPSDVDDFNRELEGYTPLTEDEGYSVEFGKDGGTFTGTFTGTKELPLNPADMIEAEKKGEKLTWTMLTFKDEKNERCNMPSNYRLDEALKAGLSAGQGVKIVHHGMRDLDGGRTLNRLSVYVKNHVTQFLPGRAVRLRNATRPPTRQGFTASA